MKILFLNQHYLPEVAATGQILAELAEDLARAGAEVTVLAGRPSYQGNGNGSRGSADLPPFGGSITLRRVYTTRFNRHTTSGRLVNYASFYSSCAVAALMERADVVVALTTPPLLSTLGALRKQIRHGKLVLWMMDIFPEIAFRYGVFKSGIMERILRRAADSAYERADIIVSLSEKMDEHLRRNGIPGEKLRIIHNWADGRALYPDAAKGFPRRDSLGINGKFVLLYSGNMGRVHDFTAVMSVARELTRDSRILFLFEGAGEQRQRLESLARSESLPNVMFVDYVKIEDLNMALNVASVSLVTQDAKSLGLVVPSKIYSSLAVGRPIVAVGPKGSEMESILGESGAGYFHENGDATGLKRSLLSLVDSAQLSEDMGRRGRNYFLSNFDRSLQTARFQTLLEDICRN
jgi:glycosyltransferase involved in cell wall biosynthesis